MNVEDHGQIDELWNSTPATGGRHAMRPSSWRIDPAEQDLLAQPKQRARPLAGLLKSETQVPRHVRHMSRDITQRRGRDSNPRWTKPPIPVFETGAFNRSATSPVGPHDLIRSLPNERTYHGTVADDCRREARASRLRCGVRLTKSGTPGAANAKLRSSAGAEELVILLEQFPVAARAAPLGWTRVGAGALGDDQPISITQRDEAR